MADIKTPNVRLFFFLAVLNKLDVLTGDIKNAYLYAKMKEKVYIVAGKEFGPLQGQVLIIEGAWYGLKTSGNCFHVHLSDNLQKEDFKLSKPDECVWLKPSNDHYDYLLTHVDDLEIALKKAKEIMKNLQETYVIKKVGPPNHYLGVKIIQKENYLLMGSKTYIKECIIKIKDLFGTIAKSRIPISPDNQPKTDSLPYLTPDDKELYQMLIGMGM